MLSREKDIASLAKMEKQFCSAPVLTENDTYLLNDSDRDKRRLKRISKRLNDSVQDDVNAPSLIRCDSSADTNSAKATTPAKKLLGSPKSFKHCNVAVRRLKKLDNMEPWCMIHCLYKCFCKGEAIDGKPFTIKKEETNEEEEIICARNKDEEMAVSHTNSPKQKYYSAGYVSGSRFVPIPTSIFLDINRKRAKSIKAKARFEETDSKRLLLRNRIVQCAILHQNDAPISKPEIITETQKVPNVVPKKPQPPVSPVKLTVESRALVKPLVDIDVFERGPAIKNSTESGMPVITSVRSLNSISTAESPCQTSTLLPTNCQNLKLQCPGEAVAAEKFHQNAIDKLNSAITKTMQSICDIQKSNSINIPAPAPRTLSSLQWKYFLPAFVNGLIFVWEVCVNRRTIIAATKKNVMPQVPDAVSATNIRALPRDKLPLIGKMLIDGLLTDKMKMLSVLMSGQDDYWWHIIGLLNSQQDYLTQDCMIQPTPDTNPRASSKVNDLYKLLFLREMNPLTNQTNQTQPANNDTERKTKATTQQPTVISPTVVCDEANTSPISRATCEIPISQLPRSNLAIRSYVQNQSETIVIPIPITADHYWLMLKIFSDFSHIYFPEWKHFLSYDRIRKALAIASINKKTVRIGKITDNMEVYVTSYSNYYVYIGPFYEQREPILVLYQHINGRMMLREDFEKSQNIKPINSTVGYWLRIANATLIYDDVPTTSASNKCLTSQKQPIDAEPDSCSSNNSYSLLAPTEPPPAKQPNISRDVPGSSGSIVIGVEPSPKKVLEIHSPTSLLMPAPEVVKQSTLPVTANVKIIATTSSPGASNTKSFSMINSKGISQNGMLKVRKSGTLLQLTPNRTTTSEYVESSLGKPISVNSATKSAFAEMQPPPLASLEHSSLPHDSNKSTPLGSSSAGAATNINHVSTTISMQSMWQTLRQREILRYALGQTQNASKPQGCQRQLDSHTGFKTYYVCDICSRAFTQLDHLRRHGDTHNPNPRKHAKIVTVSNQLPTNAVPKFKISDFSPKTANGNKVVISKLPTEINSESNTSSSPSSLLVSNLQHTPTVSEAIFIDD